MSPEQLTQAIARLELNERVALRLAAGRNLLDNELASALGISSELARELLRAAIDRVAEDVGMTPNETWVELRGLSAEDWQATARLARAEEEAPLAAEPEPELEPEPALEPEPEPAPVEEVEDVEPVWDAEDEPPPAPPAEEAEVVDEPPARGRGRSPLTLLVGALILAVIVAVVAFLADGNSSDRKGTSSASAPARPAGPSVTRVDARTLRVDAGTALPPGPTYEAWLFDSLLDAKPLGILHRGTTTLTIPAGTQLSHYRSIDISRQPGSTTVHSGLSVLRAPTAALAPGHAVPLRRLATPR